jgi:hypothetical protein
MNVDRKDKELNRKLKSQRKRQRSWWSNWVTHEAG